MYMYKDTQGIHDLYLKNLATAVPLSYHNNDEAHIIPKKHPHTNTP